MKIFLKQGLVFTIFKYIAMAVAFFKSMLIAKYLGPSLLGSYAYIMLLVEYISYYNLGVYSSMNREVSIYKEDLEKKDYIEKLINISFTFSLLFSVPILLIVMGLDKFPLGTISKDIFQYRYEIFSLIVLFQIRVFFVQYFRLFEKYYVLNIFELVANISMVIGIILFIEKYLLNSVIYIAIFGNVLVLLIGLMNSRKIKFEWDFNKLKYLIAVGFPLLIYALSGKIFTTIDRLMIAQFLSRSDLGYYQFGNTIAFGVMMVIDSITFIFYPKFLKSYYYKTKKQFEEKKKGLRESIYFMEYFSSLIVIVGIFILPMFITFFMPQYLNSILITKILLIGFSFKPLIFLTSTFLVANDKQISLIPTVLVALILLATMNYYLILYGYGINGVVIATAVAFSLYAIAVYSLIFKSLHSLIVVWRLYLFFIIGCGIVVLGAPTYTILLLWILLYYSRTRDIYNIVKVNIIN